MPLAIDVEHMVDNVVIVVASVVVTDRTGDADAAVTGDLK